MSYWLLCDFWLCWWYIWFCCFWLNWWCVGDFWLFCWWFCSLCCVVVVMLWCYGWLLGCSYVLVGFVWLVGCVFCLDCGLRWRFCLVVVFWCYWFFVCVWRWCWSCGLCLLFYWWSVFLVWGLGWFFGIWWMGRLFFWLSNSLVWFFWLCFVWLGFC